MSRSAIGSALDLFTESVHSVPGSSWPHPSWYGWMTNWSRRMGLYSINEEGSFIHNTKLGTYSYTKWILSTMKQPIWSCATLSWMNTLYSSVVVISGLKSRIWCIVVLASAQISRPVRHAPAMVSALMACAVTPLFCRLKTCSLANSKDSLYNPF